MDRSADATQGHFPDFIIIGAAKSGTTTLYEYLRRHPAIFMAVAESPKVRNKEPNFFDPAEHWHLGVDWYRSLFAGASADQLCGEASTNYTRWPQVDGVPERIASIAPEVRLIYLMRHPVERAYSHYVHRHTREIHPGRPISNPFERFVEEHPMCVDSSDYATQIARYLEFFDREAILLLRMEDLQSDPGRVVQRTTEFLGIEADPGSLTDEPLIANVGGVSEAVLRAHVMAPLRSNPFMRRIADALPSGIRDGLWKLLRSSPYGRAQREQYSAPPMLPETRGALLDRFRESNRILRDEFGVDTSGWDR
ncbi:MAG: sulfotransferase domain-containing protein [bacterium]|nr:sulfotransferase domain-containing protein [bacterium]